VSAEPTKLVPRKIFHGVGSRLRETIQYLHCSEHGGEGEWTFVSDNAAVSLPELAEVAGLLDGQRPAEVRVTHRVTLAETALGFEVHLPNMSTGMLTYSGRVRRPGDAQVRVAPRVTLAETALGLWV
jgi:hypothetical protein